MSTYQLVLFNLQAALSSVSFAVPLVTLQKNLDVVYFANITNKKVTDFRIKLLPK